MHIEKFTDTDYKIIILFKIDDSIIGERIENIIVKLKKKLQLSGFYKVFMTTRDYGVFLILKKSNNSYNRNILNIEIINTDLNIFFKTEDYFLIKKEKNVLYYDGYYYLLMDDAINYDISMFEFGNFVYGDDIIKMLKHAIIV